MFRKTRRQELQGLDPVLLCSFCGKSSLAVRKLIAGPAVYICDACVGICVDILKEDEAPATRVDPQPRPGGRSPALPGAVACALCRVPQPPADCLLVPERGIVCAACAQAVASALGSRGLQEPT